MFYYNRIGIKPQHREAKCTGDLMVDAERAKAIGELYEKDVICLDGRVMRAVVIFRGLFHKGG